MFAQALCSALTLPHCPVVVEKTFSPYHELHGVRPAFFTAGQSFRSTYHHCISIPVFLLLIEVLLVSQCVHV